MERFASLPPEGCLSTELLKAKPFPVEASSLSSIQNPLAWRSIVPGGAVGLIQTAELTGDDFDCG